MPETTEPNLLELRQALADAYEIEAPIARGGMGFVYLARERRLERRVAIKVLPPDLAVDAACRRRFLREARTAAGLTHPNIVPIFAVDESGTFVFFAMAYVPGETLAQRVAARGPLSAEEAARLLRDIGGALAYAHARGVVHRDVKPDNILLDAATGRALLSDFGIAHVSPGGRPGAAPRGPVLGTAAFMSPEQARGDPVDARSDVYSLGVVAYYALSARLPFDAMTDAALLALHIAAPAPPLASRAPWVPPRLAHIVDRCLAKDPWARFADTAALVRAVVDAVEPPAAPLAVRAFLVRSKHLAEPARIHMALTGLVLLPAAVATWLSTPTPPGVRAAATAALAVALLAPLVVAIARVRGLIAAGHRREELVAALAAHRARRLEELAFVYGSGPARFERVLQWLARLALAAAAAAVGVVFTTAELPPQLTLLLAPAAVGAAGTALLAAIAARSRTEQRTDPPGERRLQFWRGPLGGVLFRLAALGLRPRSPIVTILGKLETPA